MSKIIVPADIVNPKRKSGYNYVNNATNAFRGTISSVPFHARAAGGTWHGPRRATVLEAAQDYCDYVNSGGALATPAALKRAGHVSSPREPLPRDPEVEAALGVLRDAKAQRRGAQGYVYLIVEAPGGRIDLSSGKVGYSTNPEKRVAELNSGNKRPLKLHYKMKGSMADEKALHKKYRKDNELNEWFALSKELILEFPKEGYCK